LGNISLEQLDVIMNGTRIKYESQIKYLGVIFDSELKFYAHADYITQKCSKKVGYISRVGRQLSMETRLLLYNCIAAPDLKFCSALLYGLPRFEIDQIQIVQNRAMRCILRCNRYTPSVTMSTILSMLPVQKMIVFAVHVFVFKLKNGL